jgi:hypothetical protein
MSKLSIPFALACLLAQAARASADITVIDIDDKAYRTRNVEFVREGDRLLVKFKEIEGAEHKRAAEDILEIRFRGLALPGSPKPSEIRYVFTNGDHLTGEIAGPGSAPDTVVLATRHLGRVELKITDASRIEVQANRHQIPADAQNAVGEDTFFTTRGNRPKGTLDSLRADAAVYVDLFDDTFKTALPIAELAAVLLARREPPPDPKGLFAIVTLTDGGALRGRIDRIEQGIVTLETVYRRAIKMTADSIAAVHFRNGRVVYLSDLPFQADENPNYIRGLTPSPSDLEFKAQRDLSVKGTKLSIRGSQFTKGLGVHARSILKFDLGGGFTKFRSTIGVDDVAGGLGNVVFEVHVDGRKVFDSGNVTGEDDPREIQVDVSRAKELKLVVQFGEEGNTGDCADWGMARLIR